MFSVQWSVEVKVPKPSASASSIVDSIILSLVFVQSKYEYHLQVK